MDRPIKNKKNLEVKILENKESSYFYIVEADTGFEFHFSRFTQKKNALEVLPKYLQYLNSSIKILKDLYKTSTERLELIILESVIRFKEPEFFKLSDRIEYEKHQKYLEIIQSKSDIQKPYKKTKTIVSSSDQHEEIIAIPVKKESSLKKTKNQIKKSVVIAKSNEKLPNVSNVSSNLMEKRSRGRPRKNIISNNGNNEHTP